MGIFNILMIIFISSFHFLGYFFLDVLIACLLHLMVNPASALNSPRIKHHYITAHAHTAPKWLWLFTSSSNILIYVVGQPKFFWFHYTSIFDFLVCSGANTSLQTHISRNSPVSSIDHIRITLTKCTKSILPMKIPMCAPWQ